jgi:hypothetical protein
MIERENGKRKRREINGERKHAQEERKRKIKGAEGERERRRKRKGLVAASSGEDDGNLYS